MYKKMFQYVVAAVLACNATPALAQTMSVHDYHRGLKELNREMATIKEELRQERKARKRLEYKHSQNQGTSGESPASAKEVDRLVRDRDILMEKVATLESQNRSRKAIYTDFSLFGTIFAEKTTVEGQSNSSRSALEPIFFGLNHQFNDTVELGVLLRKGTYAGSSPVAVHNAYIDTKLRDDWSIRAGRFDLPMNNDRQSIDPSTYRTVVPALYQQALAPIGLTADGVGLSLYQERGLRGGIYVHNGFEADRLDGRTGLQAMTFSEGRSFEKLGVTARLDYQTDTTLAGGFTAMYSGLARSADSFGLANSPAGGSITGILVDAEVKIIGLELATGYAHYEIDESEEINSLYGRGIGSAMTGFFIQGAFNLFSLGFETSDELILFARYDQANPEESPKGFARSPENLRRQTTFGLNYDLAKGVSFKADHTILNDDSRATKDGSATRLGISFSF